MKNLTRQHTIEVWKSFHYRELFQVTEMKGGAVYKTKSLGHVEFTGYREKLEKYFPSPYYILASVSTPSDLNKEYMTLNVIYPQYFAKIMTSRLTLNLTETGGISYE